jgi:hypothetical protein
VGTTDSIRIIEEDDSYDDMWNNAIRFGYNSDAFYKRLIINVDGELREKISLNRILAMISINIKDKMPYSAETISIEPEVYPEDPYNYVFRYLEMPTGKYFRGDRNGVPHYDRYESPIPEAFKNKTNNTFNYRILMLDTTRISMNFSVKDNNGNVLGSKKVLNIPVKPNGKVTLSGNLFDGLTADSSGASIIVNPAWDSSYWGSVEF